MAMAHQHGTHGRPQVIQGNFQGGQPTFVAQARPAIPETGQRPQAPHVQAALQQHAPPGQTAQQHQGPQPPAAQLNRIGNAFQVPPTVNLSHPGQGRPLPEAVRQKMESVFNTDFSDVRVHVGAQAQSIGAVAFTMGSQIHFAPGQYNPNTSHGQRLLGHELTHVMQQRAGRVRNPFGDGVAVVQDPGMEAEADRMGRQAAIQKSKLEEMGAAQPHRTTPAAPHRGTGIMQLCPVTISGTGYSTWKELQEKMRPDIKDGSAELKANKRKGELWRPEKKKLLLAFNDWKKAKVTFIDDAAFYEEIRNIIGQNPTPITKNNPTWKGLQGYTSLVNILGTMSQQYGRDIKALLRGNQIHSRGSHRTNPTTGLSPSPGVTEYGPDAGWRITKKTINGQSAYYFSTTHIGNSYNYHLIVGNNDYIVGNNDYPIMSGRRLHADNMNNGA